MTSEDVSNRIDKLSDLANCSGCKLGKKINGYTVGCKEGTICDFQPNQKFIAFLSELGWQVSTERRSCFEPTRPPEVSSTAPTARPMSAQGNALGNNTP